MKIPLFAVVMFGFLAASPTVFAWADDVPAVSSAPAVSTTSVVPIAISTPSAVPPVVSTSPLSTVAVSSVSVPVDHVENVYLRRLVGTIRTIDPAAYKLVLEDHDGKPHEFILTQRTRATTEDGHRVNVSVLKPGDRVMIRYVENYNYVRKIDCLSASPADSGR